MIKLKTKTKDCYLTAKLKLSSEMVLDTTGLDMFSRKMVRGFLKGKAIKNNLIEYTGPVGITLYERLKKPISKYDFFFIIEQIVDATRKLQKYEFPWNNVSWNINHCFVNETTKELQFIYVPLVNNANQSNIMEFMESIIYSSKPFGENDTDFVSRFVYFLKDLKQYEPQKIEEYIKSEDRSIVNTIRKHTTGGSGFITDKPKDYYEHYEKDENDEDEATGLLEENDEPTGLLNETEDEATGLLVEDEGTALLDESQDDEATGLLIENDVNEKEQTPSCHFASLTRIITNETINIDKPVFRLGKERSYVDYFVTNNNAVSRSHADIITRGNRFFIKDLNSKNRTFINGEALPPQVECEIYDGNTLKLGNEEFIFNV